MKHTTCDFEGWDGTKVKLKLQSGGYYNSNIKSQACTVVGCKNLGDHVRISDKGIANLIYCHAHAEGYLMAELGSNTKPRGHWFSVWKGKLSQMYEEAYLAQNFIEKILNAKKYQKRYLMLSNYLKEGKT